MVPPRTNRTNRDPYGWRCPEGITALPRNCHVSATARKNLAQSGTQPGGEMYRRRVASDQSRVAQLKYQHLRASTKACQEFSGSGQYPPHFKKPHWQIRRHGKWMSASFPGKDNIGWPRPRRKYTISKVAIKCVNHGRRSKELHWRRWFTSLQPARPWRRMPRFPSA